MRKILLANKKQQNYRQLQSVSKAVDKKIKDHLPSVISLDSDHYDHISIHTEGFGTFRADRLLFLLVVALQEKHRPL